MFKIFKRFIEYWNFQKRKSQILQTATDFWNEQETKIKEREKYETAI